MSLKDNVEKGRIGEDIAKEYLQKLGYKIIDMNCALNIRKLESKKLNDLLSVTF